MLEKFVERSKGIKKIAGKIGILRKKYQFLKGFVRKTSLHHGILSGGISAGNAPKLKKTRRKLLKKFKKILFGGIPKIIPERTGEPTAEIHCLIS